MEAVMPDAEALLATFLRGHDALVPFHGGRVGTRLSGTYPAIRVAHTGGPAQPAHQTSQPTLQVECWAVSRADASDMARTVCAALSDIAAAYPDAHVAGARVSSEPFPAPDDERNLERFIVPVLLLLQPPHAVAEETPPE